VASDLGPRFFPRSGAEEEEEEEFLGATQREYVDGEGEKFIRRNVVHTLVAKHMFDTATTWNGSENEKLWIEPISKEEYEELQKLIECQDPRILGAYEDYFQHVTAIIPEPSMDDFSGETLKRHMMEYESENKLHLKRFADRMRTILRPLEEADEEEVY
jgi:hypothetical protein